MAGDSRAGHKEEAAPEEPLLDSRGWPLIRLKKVFPCMSNSDIAARAHFFAGLRALSEADYMAGRGLTVETIVREDPRYGPRDVSYSIGGSPRKDRSYAEMEAKLVSAVRAAHAAYAKVKPGQ